MKTLIVICVFIGSVFAQDQCRTVNGGAGSCILLENCDPLNNINKKRVKTAEDLTYLRRSACGLHLNVKPQVCCPPNYEWPDFSTERPVTYPTNNQSPEVPTGSTTTPKEELVHVTPLIPISEGSCEPTLKPPPPGSLCCGIESGYTDRIIGGKSTTPTQFPWLALLEYANPTVCGGALISSRYVLTAAHCIGTRFGDPTRVRLAEYNTSSYPVDAVETLGGGIEYVTVVIIDVLNAVTHPQYMKHHKEYDIGLIKLKVNAPYTDFIRPICLPIEDIALTKNEVFLFASGWGSNGVEISSVKLFATMPLVPKDKCQIPYSLPLNYYRLNDNQICAGGEKDVDTCKGDSGGPLMYEAGTTYVVVGITSFGHQNCGSEGYPGIYTNVFKYRDWIIKNCV